MPCGEEQKTWRTAKRSGGTPSSLQCEIYTLFAASQCLSPMLCSSVCKLYTYPHTFRLSPEPAVTTCGVRRQKQPRNLFIISYFVYSFASNPKNRQRSA